MKSIKKKGINANALILELKKSGNKQGAENALRFFKSGKGEYGEGDVFLGISVPKTRNIAMSFLELGLPDIKELLDSKWHEARLAGLFILRENFRKSKKGTEKKQIVTFYLKHLYAVNNWDLVDASAYQILGEYLQAKDRKVLYRLASSKKLWERRVAIISCFAFIRKKDLDDCFKISELLLFDKEDLIRKAVGWMLREAGKKDEKRMKDFILNHIKDISRTSLRYAIERLSVEERRKIISL
jgi:3-methyladenine DNA glycosylase AlkD